jgi:bacterial/archaeal transporter family-2 protein
MPIFLVLFVIVLAGVALATQAPLNAALARTLETPVAAAAVSFGVGFAVLTLVTLAVDGPGPFQRLAQAPWWQWAGGFLGAFYVWAVIFGVPQAGVLTTFAALILGQMTAAIVLDATGAFGVPVHEVSLTRIAAAALVAGGVVLSRVGS